MVRYTGVGNNIDIAGWEGYYTCHFLLDTALISQPILEKDQIMPKPLKSIDSNKAVFYISKTSISIAAEIPLLLPPPLPGFVCQ